MTELIVALDTTDMSEAESMAEELKGSVGAFKVGLTLLASYGPDAIDVLRSYGPIFADVKYHDIPEQIRLASRALSHRQVWMFTVHSSGGEAMVRAAVEGARNGRAKPIVAGVTVLTSLSATDLDRVGQGGDLERQTVHLAEQVTSWGATAVVSPGQLIKPVRNVVGDTVPIVVPGVRPVGVAAGDQSSVVTPEMAARDGADYIVVGRPITKATDPARA
ncbi:MAG: orotidine-5'-phosphate decarboxylase, partial [Acidimicrobiia bacterium]